VAAILNYRHPVTSGGIGNIAIELLDHENVGVAVGISLLSCLEAEIEFISVRKQSNCFRHASPVPAVFSNVSLAIKICKIASM